MSFSGSNKSHIIHVGFLLVPFSFRLGFPCLLVSTLSTRRRLFYDAANRFHWLAIGSQLPNRERFATKERWHQNTTNSNRVGAKMFRGKDCSMDCHEIIPAGYQKFTPANHCTYCSSQHDWQEALAMAHPWSQPGDFSLFKQASFERVPKTSSTLPVTSFKGTTLETPESKMTGCTSTGIHWD